MKTVLTDERIDDIWHTYNNFEEQARAVEQAVLESPEVQRMGGWQPISTAPKDGTFVLLRSANGRVADGFFGVRCGVWSWPYVMIEPIYWMPLPILNAAMKEQQK